MRFRSATVSDLPALGALALASKAHWGYSARQLEQWRDDLTPHASWIGARPFVVAENDDGLMGFYTLEPGGDGICALDNLWIRPGLIGQGFGRRLFAHAADRARALGATEMHIDAEPHAEPFYLSRGARRLDAVAAPIDGEPARVRPQLTLRLEPA